MAINWSKILSLEAICRRHSGSSARLEVREGKEDGREGDREREKDSKREVGRGGRGVEGSCQGKNSKHTMPMVNEGRDLQGMNQSEMAGGRRGRGRHTYRVTDLLTCIESHWPGKSVQKLFDPAHAQGPFDLQTHCKGP